MPLSWSHSTRSWMPVDSSHAVVSGKRPTSLLMDCGALLQAASHPARDHVDAHPVQCVWLSDVWAPSICTTRLGDASVCRGVVQSVRSDQDRFAAWLSCSAAGIHLLEGVKALPVAVADTRQVAQAATTLRCRQDQSTSVSQTPRGSRLACRGIHRDRMVVRLDKRGE